MTGNGSYPGAIDPSSPSADAPFRAQTAVTDYMQAGGSLATVRAASNQLLDLAQQLAAQQTSAA